MEAMQKHRVRKVAIAHFVLTFVPVIILLLTDEFYGSPSDSVRYDLWIKFWLVSFCLMQPQFGIIFVAIDLGAKVGWWDYQEASYEIRFSGVVYFISVLLIPIWSNCFGWFFIKLDDWLNHFPVLDRKVF
jgi:hypothetical protein